MTNASTETETSEKTDSTRQYPFGLKSWHFAILVVIAGLVLPGVTVYSLEQAGLSFLGNIVWIIGYGTAVFVVWYIWLRPIDLVGTTGHSISIDYTEEESGSRDHKNEDTETATEEAVDSSTTEDK
jgi:hypothetical protein